MGKTEATAISIFVYADRGSWKVYREISSDIARYDGKQETITVASRMQFVLVRFYGGKKRGEGIFVGGLFTVNVCRHNTALSREK